MRKKRKYNREFQPDPIYDNVEVTRFINALMKDGEKTTAERVMYKAFDIVKETTNQDPLQVFTTALDNVTPAVEVVSRRIGGANYQVPKEVRPARKFSLAVRWLANAARGKRGKPMAERLAEEIVAASRNEGAAIKKKFDMHRMAEANKAFAHFRW